MRGFTQFGYLGAVVILRGLSGCLLAAANNRALTTTGALIF